MAKRQKKARKTRRNFLLDTTTDRGLDAIVNWLEKKTGDKHSRTDALKIAVHRMVRQIIEGDCEL